MIFVVASAGLSIAMTLLAVVNAIDRLTRSRELQYQGLTSRLDALLRTLKQREG